MAQQTAVEWLVDNLPQRFKNAMLISGKEIIEEAKQMEKEQIINAWRNGDNDSMYEPEQLDEQAELYYSETYKK